MERKELPRMGRASRWGGRGRGDTAFLFLSFLLLSFFSSFLLSFFLYGPNGKRNSGAQQGRNVAILQNHPVVALVTGNDEGQSQGSNFVLAGYAATKPGRGVQRTHECDRRLANGGEFLKQILDFTRGKIPC